jgi:TMEM175 potassium channel family protein
LAFSGLLREGLTKGRIEALTDGIFATVMTILVLGLRVPVLNAPVPEEALSAEIVSLWPSFLIYALSFVTLGLYWVGHHTQFHYVKHVDRVLLWINILFLLSIGFIPFSTLLLGDYPWPPTAVRVYGGNLIANSLLLYLIWWYATSGDRLVEKGFDPHIVTTAKRRILVGPTVVSLGLIASFFDTRASVILYMLVIPFYIRPSHIDIHFRGAHEQAEH